MKTNLKTIFAAIVGALLVLPGCATSPHAAAAWEYRVIEGWTSPDARTNFEKALNDAGQEGYVVASSTTLPREGSNAPKTIVILKRPKP